MSTEINKKQEKLRKSLYKLILPEKSEFSVNDALDRTYFIQHASIILLLEILKKALTIENIPDDIKELLSTELEFFNNMQEQINTFMRRKL